MTRTIDPAARPALEGSPPGRHGALVEPVPRIAPEGRQRGDNRTDP